MVDEINLNKRLVIVGENLSNDIFLGSLGLGEVELKIYLREINSILDLLKQGYNWEAVKKIRGEENGKM